MAARAREPKAEDNAGALDARAVVDRMKEATGVKSDIDLGSTLGTPAATILTWKKRGAIPLRTLIGFARDRHVSLDWLVFGTEVRAAEAATAEALHRAGQEAGRASHGGDYQRDDLLSALFRARPEVMEMMTRFGHRTEADIRAMLNDTKTMTLDVLEEMRDHFCLPLGVMIDGKAEMKMEALETALSITLANATLNMRPALKGVTIDKEDSVLCTRASRAQWHLSIISHLAALVAHNYRYIVKRDLEEPGWAEEE